MVVSPIGKSRTTPQSRSDAPALRDSGLHASRESDISPGFRSSSGADLAKCGRWGAFRKLGLPTDHTSRSSVPQEGPVDRPLRGQGFRLRLHPRPLRAFPPRTSPPTQRTPSAMRLRRSAPSRSQAHSPWLRLPLASGPEFHSQGSRLRASVTPPASPSVAQEALCPTPLVPVSVQVFLHRGGALRRLT